MTETITPMTEIDGYTPDVYVSTVAHRMFGTPDNTTEQAREHQHAVKNQVRAAAHRVAGTTMPAPDQHTPDNQRWSATVGLDWDMPWPDGMSPDDYISSLAARIAGPVWPDYTQVQQQRMRQFAAKYLIREVTRFFDRAPGLPLDVRDALPREARRELTGKAVKAAAYQRRLTMLLGYLETHPGDEIVPSQMHLLAETVKDPSQPWFF